MYFGAGSFMFGGLSVAFAVGSPCPRSCTEPFECKKYHRLFNTPDSMLSFNQQCQSIYRETQCTASSQRPGLILSSSTGIPTPEPIRCSRRRQNSLPVRPPRDQTTHNKVSLTGRNATGPPSRATPGELRCICECYRQRQTKDNDRRQQLVLLWLPTLCVDRPVIIHRC